MIAELRHFDTPLVRFSVIEDSNTPEIQILWLNEPERGLLPLDLAPTPEGLSRWLRHRAIPKNRAFVHNFLAKCGLSANRPVGIIRASKGLSLNDCYWVAEEGSAGTFAGVNLYVNPIGPTKCRRAPVAAQVRAIFPVFCGISGSTNTILICILLHFLLSALLYAIFRKK